MALNFSRIAIVGSGALGCYYGARFERARPGTVNFLMRSDLETVQRDGMTVKMPGEMFWLSQVSAFARSEDIGPCDLVVVALKTTANAQLDELIRPLLAEHTTILTLQNGLGSDEQLATLFGARRICGGLCFVCVNRLAPGEIECRELGSVSVGEFARNRGEQARAIDELFTLAGVKCLVGDDLAELRWRKLVWNIPFNGLAIAAGGITTDLILADPKLEETVRDLMLEVVTAAGKMGHEIPLYFIDQQIENTRRMGAYKPSSLIDYLAGKEVELESIWGEPLRRAKRAGAEMPRLEWLYQAILELTRQRA